MNRLRFVSFATLLAVAMLGAPGIAQVDSLPNTARPSPAPPEPGLLFYLSADHGFNADYAAGGNATPNYLSDVKILPGGAKGSYLQCGNHQLLSYWAPGNIYAQRGTLSFYWRSRDPDSICPVAARISSPCPWARRPAAANRGRARTPRRSGRSP